MSPLDERQRKRVLAMSAVLCAVPLCLAPLAGRSSFELAGERAVLDSRFAAPVRTQVWNARPVSVTRDPFVPESPRTPAPPPLDKGIVGMHVTQGQPITSLPIVTAVVTGASARALIDDGTAVRVIKIGDPLYGSRVASIDGSGVRLQNGKLLPLVGAAP